MPCFIAQNRRHMGWDHDPDVCGMLRDRLVSRRSIIGAICCHLFDVFLYLIKQRPHLGRVSYFFLSERLVITHSHFLGRRFCVITPNFRARFLRLQTRVSRIVWKGFAPLSLAVSTVVRTSASAWAAHMAR